MPEEYNFQRIGKDINESLVGPQYSGLLDRNEAEQASLIKAMQDNYIQSKFIRTEQAQPSDESLLDTIANTTIMEESLTGKSVTLGDIGRGFSLGADLVYGPTSDLLLGTMARMIKGENPVQALMGAGKWITDTLETRIKAGAGEASGAEITKEQEDAYYHNRPAYQLLDNMLPLEPGQKPSGLRDIAALGLDVIAGILTGNVGKVAKESLGAALKAMSKAAMNPKPLMDESLLRRAPTLFQMAEAGDTQAMNRIKKIYQEYNIDPAKYKDMAGREIVDKFAEAQNKAHEAFLEGLVDLINKADSGDRKAQAEVAKFMTDPFYHELFGRYTAQNLPDMSRMGRLGSKEATEAEIKVSRKLEEMRKKGSTALLARELNGDFARDPWKLAKEPWNWNTAADLANYMKKTTAEMTQYVENSFKQIDKLKHPHWKKFAAEALTNKLSEQRSRLEMTIGDVIQADITNIQAFAYQHVLDSIAQTMEQMLKHNRDGYELAFTSSRDILRMWKLIGAREQIIADLTATQRPTARMMSLIYTGAPDNNKALRALNVQSALLRAPMISPVVAKTMAAEAGRQLKDSSKISPEEFSKLREVLWELRPAAEARIPIAKSEYNAVAEQGRKILMDNKDSLDKNMRKVRAFFTYLGRLERKHEINDFLNSIGRKTFMENIESYYINSALSSPGMHGLNALNNAVKLIGYPLQDIAASLYHVARGNTALAGMNLGSAVARLSADAQFSLDLFKLIARWGIKALPKNVQETETLKRATRLSVLKNLDDFSGAHEAYKGSTTFSRETLDRMGAREKAAYYVSQMLNFPSYLTMAGDKIFKAALWHGNLRADSWQRAYSLANSPRDARRLFEKFMKEPTDRMAIDAYHNALEGTYQQELTDRVSNVAHAISRSPLKWFALFFKTPWNIMRESANMIPIVNTTPVLIDRFLPDFMRGGAFERALQSNMLVSNLNAGGSRARAAQGLLALTNGLFLGMLMAPTEGIITGGGGLPMPNKKYLAYPEYTIFNPSTGSTFYYGNIPFLRMLLGTPITIKEIFQQVDWDDEDMAENIGKATHGMIAHFAGILADNMFMMQVAKGITDIRRAWETGSWGPVMKMAARMAGPAFIPYSSGIGYASRRLDPWMRETDNFFEALKQRYGFGNFTEKIPYTLDVFGNKRKLSLTSHYEVVDMTRLDPATQELRRLRPNLRKVREVSTEPADFGTRYTQQDRAAMRYLIATGQDGTGQPPMHEYIMKLISSPEYLRMTDAEKRAYIEYAWRKRVDAAEKTWRAMLGNKPLGGPVQ